MENEREIPIFFWGIPYLSYLRLVLWKIINIFAIVIEG